MYILSGFVVFSGSILKGYPVLTYSAAASISWQSDNIHLTVQGSECSPLPAPTPWHRLAAAVSIDVSWDPSCPFRSKFKKRLKKASHHRAMLVDPSPGSP
jgi:hypothetical protein